jgi:hypothetical protein
MSYQAIIYYPYGSKSPIHFVKAGTIEQLKKKCEPLKNDESVIQILIQKVEDIEYFKKPELG